MVLENLYNKSPIFLQNFMLNIKAIELYLERYGNKFDIIFDRFKNNETLSKDKMKEYQTKKLLLLTKHAYNNVQYYNELFKKNNLHPNDIRTLSDIEKIPILTKNLIRANFNKLKCSNTKNYKIRQGHTSGTTGSPLDILYDINTCVIHHVADWRQKTWAGLQRGTPYASLQGRLICPINQKRPPFWRMNYINNQLFLSTFHLKKENIPYYFEELRKRKINFLEGYPSAVFTLASYLKSTNQKFTMKAILTSSETLYDFQKEIIENSFNCKIYDFYGMAERCIFATECEEHSGRHINEDYGITEFVDSDNIRVSPGLPGKIVATSLHNFAFPLIRYETSDWSTLNKKQCACGRNFPLMDKITTKNESIISLPDGRWISPSILTHPLKPIHGIIESQIKQDDDYSITIYIVKNDLFDEGSKDKLLNSFRNRLGEKVPIQIKYTDSIQKEANGKFKWVTSKIKPTF